MQSRNEENHVEPPNFFFRRTTIKASTKPTKTKENENKTKPQHTLTKF